MNELQTIITVAMALVIGFIFGRSSKRSNDFRNEYITEEEQARLSPKTQYQKKNIPWDVLEAIKSGSKINAVKKYRAHFDCSLKEAKEAVETLKQQLK